MPLSVFWQLSMSFLMGGWGVRAVFEDVYREGYTCMVSLCIWVREGTHGYLPGAKVNFISPVCVCGVHTCVGAGSFLHFHSFKARASPRHLALNPEGDASLRIIAEMFLRGFCRALLTFSVNCSSVCRRGSRQDVQRRLPCVCAHEG